MNHCSYVYITIRHKKVNTVFYIFEALEKTVARSWGKDKQTLSSRRYISEDTFLAYVPLRSASEAEAGLRFLAPMRATEIR